MLYVVTVKWIKGTSNLAPDALSRQPTSDPSEDDLIEGNMDTVDMRRYLSVSAIQIGGVSAHYGDSLDTDGETWDPRLKRIAEATAVDEELQEVIEAIKNGRQPAKPYQALADNATVVDGILLFKSRIVVPKSLRSEILKDLHSAHLGFVRTKQRARQTVFWPKITSDIEDVVRACERCQCDRPSHGYEPIAEGEERRDARAMEEIH